MRTIASTLALVGFAAACAPAGRAPAAPDPLSGLRYLVGTWNCTYSAGRVRISYKAHFAYALGDNWMRESDSWSGGGGDVAMFTYEPKRRAWTAIIVDNERTTAVMRATGSNPDHVTYHSVIPDASMSESFDRTSPSRYEVRFTQHARGKTLKSTDVCVKA